MSSTVIERSPAAAGARRRLRIIQPPSFSLSSLLGCLSELPEYVDLIYTLSAHRIKVRYKQSALGFSWALFQPLSMMMIYTGIFAYIMQRPSEGVPYPVFSFTALLPWM